MADQINLDSDILHSNNNFNWDDFLQSNQSVTHLDLSQRNISYIPDLFYANYSNLQSLYLKGNNITDLTSRFFPTLRKLRWLDVRNNRLKTIPVSIVDHPCLEVLLLEGNQIEVIPVEIGSVSSLRGLQLAKNPIVFPPQNIISQGAQQTIDFLKKQWWNSQSPEHIQLISETHLQPKSVSAKSKQTLKKKQKAGLSKSAVLKVNSHEPRKSHRNQARHSAANLSKCISVLPIPNHTRTSASADNWMIGDHHDQILNHIRCKINSRENDQYKKPKLVSLDKVSRNNDDDLQPKFLRDLWIEKTREMLMKQDAIIQQRKSGEALKQWQDVAKISQEINPKSDFKAGMNFPYATDPEYLTVMYSKDPLRKEHQRDSLLHTVHHEEPINNKILSMMAALADLQISQSATAVSPRSEQKALAQEIKKIKDIQRSLNVLKSRNFGQISIS